MGGRETLLSYGVSAQEYDYADVSGIVDLARSVLPEEHLDWLRKLRNSYSIGDYFFAHAGVRPGVQLDNQLGSDLRWIRSDFLQDSSYHGKMIVHGHSVQPAVDERSNRIGVDTGAYATGQLTAIGLEQSVRWFLTTDAY